MLNHLIEYVDERKGAAYKIENEKHVEDLHLFGNGILLIVEEVQLIDEMRDVVDKFLDDVIDLLKHAEHA